MILRNREGSNLVAEQKGLEILPGVGKGSQSCRLISNIKI